MQKNASRLRLKAFFFIYYDQVLKNLYIHHTFNKENNIYDLQLESNKNVLKGRQLLLNISAYSQTNSENCRKLMAIFCVTNYTILYYKCFFH